MIAEPPHPRSEYAGAWTAGIAFAVLAIGVYGVAQPLVPVRETQGMPGDTVDEVMVMDFVPSASPAVEEAPPEAPPEPEMDLEIPPLPEIVAPITPPEMIELTPLEEPPPAPAPRPRALPVRPRPPTEQAGTAPTRSAASSGATSGATGTGAGPVATFTGEGRGRFPSPGYPTAARLRKEEGVVRLLVTVEASGLPSSVSVQSSSGSATLDNAACDHIQRRWRWPAGAVRRYIVPIRFRLE